MSVKDPSEKTHEVGTVSLRMILQWRATELRFPFFIWGDSPLQKLLEVA